MNFLIASVAPKLCRASVRFRCPANPKLKAQTQIHFSTDKNHVEVPAKNVKADENEEARSKEATKSEDYVDDSEIQPEWLSLEKRLAFRKPKRKGDFFS